MVPTSRKKLGPASCILALLTLATACSLNPQPEPPGLNEVDTGDAGPGGFPSGGSTGAGTGAGGSGPAGTGGAGGSVIIAADSAAPPGVQDAAADSVASGSDAALGDTGGDSGTPADARDAAGGLDGSDTAPGDSGGAADGPDTAPTGDGGESDVRPE